MAWLAAGCCTLHAQQQITSAFTGFGVTNQNSTATWTIYPHADQYEVMSTTNLGQTFLANTNGTFAGAAWNVTNSARRQFFRLKTVALSSNALLNAQVLNRLTYGPTPDEIDRINNIGAQAYIDEQLAPEAIAESGDAYVKETVNTAPLPPTNTWLRASFTGIVSGTTRSNVMIYLRTVGTVYVDDVRVVAGTNADAEPNLVVNGDFEAPLTTGWSLAANVAGSYISSTTVHAGSGSLCLVSTSPGSNQTTCVSQLLAPVLTNNQVVTLSFWYLQTTNSHLLNVRLGDGDYGSGQDGVTVPTWYYTQLTGVASNSGTLYIYLNGAGDAYLDDISLVAGSVAGVGSNLLANGNFETGNLNPWRTSTDFTNSAVSSNYAHAGNYSLHLIATSSGSGSGDSLYQTNIPGITNGLTYTLSYWYMPASNSRMLTTRLLGAGAAGVVSNSPDLTLGGQHRRLDAGTAMGHDLRAWFIQNAVQSKRQLLEIMLQFLDNHFVTQLSKSSTYLGNTYRDTTLREQMASQWEYNEISKWRAALLRPDCTFYDLLKISAESPAMIVYLDTVDSKGSSSNIANENYARELFELFCMGVDNGYDQNDIVAMSRSWTGWTIEIVEPDQANNPFAPRTDTFGRYPGVGYNVKSNLLGNWCFNYKFANHGTNRAPIFPGKTVPARFGAPWAGMNYQLTIPGRTGTNSIQDGYDSITHLANLPFTMEYISVKLCRLFVHDNFPNPTTKTNLAEYAFYDYTNPNMSAEADLVHKCMVAWWNATPRGNIRTVLKTIFDSDLFRTQAGISQKIKTPLEFTVSGIRALRAAKPDGTYTASTDGYSIAGRAFTASYSYLNRMGTMLLFDREAPDGYPETGPIWVNASSLSERVRFVQTLLMPVYDTNKADAITGGNLNLSDPVGLLKLKLGSVQWNDAGAVADYFISILYPAEGKANLNLYHVSAVNFLNTADDGVTPSLFSGLSNAGIAYDQRVRGMVSMLMTFQRFQEQ